MIATDCCLLPRTADSTHQRVGVISLLRGLPSICLAAGYFRLGALGLARNEYVVWRPWSSPVKLMRIEASRTFSDSSVSDEDFFPAARAPALLFVRKGLKVRQKRRGRARASRGPK